MTKTTRFFVLLSIAAFVLGFASWAALSTAEGAPPAAKQTVCMAAWRAAPDGQRWPARAKCIRRIEHLKTCRSANWPVPAVARVKGQRIDAGQRHVLGWVLNQGRIRKLGQRVTIAAVVATTQEATARELGGGHGTSAGPFQLISTHGKLEQRITVEFSGNWFYNGAKKVDRGQAPADLAQDVERSGHPHAYRQWVPEATSTATAFFAQCDDTRKQT